MGCSGSTAAPVAAAPAGNFIITLERSDLYQQIGLDVLRAHDPVGILVAGVAEDGLVPIYNKHHASISELEVKEGDVIVAVNSVFGDYDKMKKECKLQKLALTITRPGGLVFASGPRPAKTAPEAMVATEPAVAGFALKSVEPAVVNSVVELTPEPAAEPAITAERAMVEAPAPPEKTPPVLLPTVKVLNKNDCTGCSTPRGDEGKPAPAAETKALVIASTHGPIREVSTDAKLDWMMQPAAEKALASERTETLCKKTICCL
eukprot:TRINITY_DN3907_c0_g2_i1.p1 TRINITY_DN3907_c0_g2~~TRINITY_DN3907_c0_g2_i1.p1  ORF type:complete len:262 (+),score=62.21 TRINITY_DN3907_c0_g2_i1:91-876(+)